MAPVRAFFEAGIKGVQRVSFRAFNNDAKTFTQKSSLRLRNGEKINPGLFTASEIDRRITNLRNHMQEQKLAACLLTSLHNVSYFTGGFIYCGFGRPYGLLVTPEKHVTITALIDFGQPWRRSPHDNLMYTDWEKDNFYKAVVEELGDTRGAVGIEFDHKNIQAFHKLKKHLPHDNDLQDICDATMWMRMIKSQEEIIALKNSAATGDIGVAACVNAIDENVPEYEVALVGTQAMVRNIAKLYPDSELMDTWVWIQSGINTDGAHNPVTTRKVQKGDILSVNCFPMPQGYYTSVERTMFFDHCNDASLKIWESNVAIHKRGLQLIKPGVKCCDVAKELNDLCAELGILKYRTFGYGHSFGAMCHYYGREAALELREDVDTVLQPGMTVSIEPMVTIPEGLPGAGGYRDLSVLVIEEDGSVENITGYPIGPEHNIIKK